MQVKMDRIRFAQLVNYLGRRGVQFDMEELNDIDSMMIYDLPEQRVTEEAVQELMRQMNAHDGFIPAIKAYRVLTGAGLREAKEAVEKYRTVKAA